MKKRIALILSAALLLVCLIYPIILKKPTGKGDFIRLAVGVCQHFASPFKPHPSQMIREVDPSNAFEIIPQVAGGKPQFLGSSVKGQGVAVTVFLHIGEYFFQQCTGTTPSPAVFTEEASRPVGDPL